MAWETNLVPGAGERRRRTIEMSARHILARTAGKDIVTDDNMGSEWRHFLGLK